MRMMQPTAAPDGEAPHNVNLERQPQLPQQVSVPQALSAIDAGQTPMEASALQGVAGDLVTRLMQAESRYRQARDIAEKVNAIADDLIQKVAALEARLAELEAPAEG